MHVVTGLFIAVFGTMVACGQEPALGSAGTPTECAKGSHSTLSSEERVFQIVRKTIEAGHSFLPNGVQAWTFVPIATEDNNEIVGMGACAVKPLTSVLDWQSNFAQLISVRLLAQLRTSEVTAPLERASEPTRWQPVRMSALYGLASNWSPQTRDVMERLTGDEDPRIRQIANSILAENIQ